MKNQPYTSLPFIGILVICMGLSFLSEKSQAQNNQSIKISSDVNSDVTERFSESDAVRIITNKDKSVDLVITYEGIAIQFTEHFLNDIENEIQSKESKGEDSSKFEKIILSMAGSGVRALLDHAIIIPFHEIKNVRYDEGRIIIIDKNGEEIFGDLEINDHLIVEDFSRRDARRFVSDAEKRLL